MPKTLTSLNAGAQDFGLFMKDDAALLRAADAQWAVVPLTNEVRINAHHCGSITELKAWKT